jgi:hypothetical protein
MHIVSERKARSAPPTIAKITPDPDGVNLRARRGIEQCQKCL